MHALHPDLSNIKFSPTETRILQLLSDGKPHTRQELVKCLWDELSSLNALQYQICTLRRKLKRVGHDIVCEINKGLHYRHIISLPQPPIMLDSTKDSKCV